MVDEKERKISRLFPFACLLTSVFSSLVLSPRLSSRFCLVLDLLSCLDFFSASFVTFQSCCDWLPTEIKERILQLAYSQHRINTEEKTKKENLRLEARMYQRLQVMWKHGLVKIDSTGAVYGCYKDLENVEREIVLGKTYVRALKRVNHVKSFVD